MPAEEGFRHTFIKPDDMHLHVRNGDVMELVAPHTAKQFARAVIMPNLVPPVRHVEEAISYKKEILRALDALMNFQPLMTLYLTQETTEGDVQKAAESGEILAYKLYPSGATTNSQFGVTSIKGMAKIFSAMEKFNIPLLVHGEVTDPDVDVFDRERVFLDNHFRWLVDNFPSLRLVLEHITTAEAVSFIKSCPSNIGATITPHHMLLTRNDIFAGGIRPHHYCLPVVKTEEDRAAVVGAAISGDAHFFAGTDSAPHPAKQKETSCGKAGIYTGWHALNLYAEVFDRMDSFKFLETFLSVNGARFYNLPLNAEMITIEKRKMPVPSYFALPDDRLIPLRAGESVGWQIVE